MNCTSQRQITQSHPVMDGPAEKQDRKGSGNEAPKHVGNAAGGLRKRERDGIQTTADLCLQIRAAGGPEWS